VCTGQPTALLAFWNHEIDTRPHISRTQGDPIISEPFSMKRPPRASRFRSFAISGILAIVCAIAGCAGGQQVTAEALEQAKQLWAKGGVHDYDLEWTVGGGQTNHYVVQVRDGKVSQIETIRSDGTRSLPKIPDTRYYSVDGLFLTIANELAQLKTDHPFDRPPGTQVVMRFKPDPKLGYPHWYHRDVMGTSLSIAIDVVKLVPQVSNSKSGNVEKVSGGN
jgi:Family of unknown function (DUF6174)